jgi:hypothetical protein
VLQSVALTVDGTHASGVLRHKTIRARRRRAYQRSLRERISGKNLISRSFFVHPILTRDADNQNETENFLNNFQERAATEAVALVLQNERHEVQTDHSTVQAEER